MRSRYPKRQGSALAILSAMIVVSLAIASYAINVEYMEFVRTEMQISTDVSVRAACRALADSGNPNDALLAAQRLADENKVAGQTLVYSEQDLSFSSATRLSVDESYGYKNSISNPNAVSLSAGFFQRSASGVDMLFPTFGIPVKFRPVKSATSVQADIDMAIVFDCSSSMIWSEFEPSPTENLINLKQLDAISPDSRWYFAKLGVLDMLDRMELTPAEEHVGLCCFGNLALTKTSLTNDFTKLRSDLTSCEAPYYGGLTDLSSGLNQAGRILSDSKTARPWACRFVMLISDGKRSLGDDPVNVASLLADQYIKVYTISVADEADQTLMQQIAAAGNGEHFHATSTAQFGELFRELSRRIPILITK
ncbi:MAG: VWA domain-containing protein [Pirellulaceae bacterium]|nr:VWA domain-containing protein [Pirellulaceae bacterium]